MERRSKFIVITYIGSKSSIEVSPRRTKYEFEQNKSRSIGFKRNEVHPLDAQHLVRKIDNKGVFLFQME